MTTTPWTAPPAPRPLAVPSPAGRADGPRAGLLAALAAQVLLLAVLSAAVGTGPAGRLAGAAFTVTVVALLARGLHRTGAVRLGPANAVTLTRAVLAGGVAALAADALVSGARPGAAWAATVLTVPALLLDLVDGLVARGTGAATALGARFDGETDAALILVLSVLVAGPVGAWVLAIGLMRYAFLVAGWLLPWLAGPLAPRYSRKVAAAVQGVVLCAALPGVLPAGLVTAAVAAALAVLTWSFWLDVRFLHRVHRVHRREAADGSGSGTPAQRTPHGAGSTHG